MALHDALSRVVTVANGKGGVGKTATACNAAGLAAAADWRVLFVDFDPQGNAGHVLGYRWSGETDDGQSLAESLIRNKPLKPTLAEVRPNLDVVPGGSQLDMVEDVAAGQIKRGMNVDERFASVLAPIAQNYDLIIVDTPPTRPLLLRLALAATRWIVVPTRPGRASIEGLRNLATEMMSARAVNPGLGLLGAVLYDVETSATVIRSNAITDIKSALGGAAPVFSTVIRHSLATAVESEESGSLVHEIAEKVDSVEPYWKALQEGRTPQRVPGSAPALAEDFVLLTQEILTAIDAHERETEVSA